MARFWITGCNGFIAREVISQLAARGDNIGGIGHFRISPPLATTDRVDGKVNAWNLDELLKKTGFPDTVIHLAGGSSVGKSFENPAEDRERTVGSTEALLSWLGRQRITPRVVIVSTAAVYGDRYSGPIPEKADTNPMSPYGIHKLNMEGVARDVASRCQIPMIIVRLFSVYGRGLKKQFFFDLCERLASPVPRLTLFGTGRELRDYLEVTDAAALLILAADRADPSVPIVNGGTGKATSIDKAATITLDAWRSHGGLFPPIHFSGTAHPGDPASLVADVAQIATWQFLPRVKLDDGITRYVDWYREEIGYRNAQ